MNQRRLHIGGVAIPLKAEHVADLYRTKIVYDCGSTDHDLHIDPDSRNWTLQGIERLCLAIVAAQAERANGEPAAGDNLAKAGAVMNAEVTVFDRVVSILRAQLDVPAGYTVTRYTTFEDGLGADSLDWIELVPAIEKEFGIRLDDADIDAIALRTVGHLVALVEQKQREAA